MFRKFVRKFVLYGVPAGLIVGLPLLVLSLVLGKPPHGAWGMALGYLTMLLALSLVFLAIKRQRDDAGGGVIGFWPALALGLGISAVASIVYVLAWEATLAITQMDFAGDYAKAVIEAERAQGASAEALAKTRAEMAQFQQQYANPLFRLPMTFIEIFPVGLLVSLVSAGLLRNSRFLPARRG